MKLSMIKKIFTGIFTIDSDNDGNKVYRGNSSADNSSAEQKLQEAYDFLDLLNNDLEEGRSDEEYIEIMIIETLEDIKILESA